MANIAASVRQRLLNIAKEKNEDFQYVLTRYGLERFLHRFGKSPHSDRFILKGAMLFYVWGTQAHRVTRDLDLLGYGDNSIATVVKSFKEICQVSVEEDGLHFDHESVQGEELHPELEYKGIRITLVSSLEKAKISIQIDIGFGDAATPSPKKVQFPTLLNFPAPSIKAYQRETVVAEKFQAMVSLGITNSRMKDFYDLWFLSEHFSFEGKILCQAIQATFSRRRTALPKELPLALTAEFFNDSMKQNQWKAFLKKGKISIGNKNFEEIIGILQTFLMPPTQTLAEGKLFTMLWKPSGPWR